jgi:hypothetical protein
VRSLWREWSFEQRADETSSVIRPLSATSGCGAMRLHRKLARIRTAQERST